MVSELQIGAKAVEFRRRREHVPPSPATVTVEPIVSPTAKKKTTARKKTSSRQNPTARTPAAQKKTAAHAGPKKQETSSTTAAKPAASAGVSLDWSGALDLTRAAELCTELKDALGVHDTVTIEAHDVENTDISCVQILLAATHTAMRDGKTVHLVDHGHELEALWQEVGFGTVYQRLVQRPEEAEA